MPLPDGEIAALLARANLLRMRGQWDEAVAVCTEALRRDSRSSTAHSLMGDIYEAQGRLDDALQWYGMALDLAPENRPDQEKLARVVAAKRSALKAEQRSSSRANRGAGFVAPQPSPKISHVDLTGTSADRNNSASSNRTLDRTLDWFDRIFPPGRAEGIARLILAMSGALAVLLLLAAGVVYLSFHGISSIAAGESEGEKGLLLSTGDAPPIAPPVRVAVPPRATPKKETAAAGTGKDKEQSASNVSPSVAVAQAPTPSPTTVLYQAIQRALPPSLSLAAVQQDPRDPTRARMDILIPSPGAEESQEMTRERILRAAIASAQAGTAAAATNSSSNASLPQRWNVRIGWRSTATPDRKEEMVFAGEVDPAALRSADLTSTAGTDLPRLFGETWWAPQLKPSNGSAPVTSSESVAPASHATVATDNTNTSLPSSTSPPPAPAGRSF